MLIIYSAQLRAARGLLKMTRKKLSELSTVNINSIRDYELCDDRLLNAKHITITKIIEIFRERGVRFVAEEKEGTKILGVTVKFNS